MRIGIIGSGNVGTALEDLFATAGHEVVVGVRDTARPGVGRSVPVLEAASAEVVVLAVPFDVLPTVLDGPVRDALAGTIVVDVTNPVRADWSPVALGQHRSAAQEIARLAPRARVVKAFNTVFADVMRPERLDRDGHRVTAFVAGDDRQAVAVVARLAAGSGLDPVVVGGTDTAWLLEALAHLNIAIAVGQGGGTNAAFVYHQVTA
jgi:8-hydroxy-5-deazaflavin:NADPH oxidoreductase